ncbi:hypothetical protein B0T21DRAFT_353747 [Apiosordaria backusii]|uniref:Uncharacterized protein n=1 Tax=Apiosordaria backusii TaxID=314023 RepID=A0AA39ZPM4_9PEZI|nr:hypothetical protein B0T21DRAFT_353747 [Apiosordaria backusii]
MPRPTNYQRRAMKFASAAEDTMDVEPSASNILFFCFADWTSPSAPAAIATPVAIPVATPVAIPVANPVADCAAVPPVSRYGSSQTNQSERTRVTGDALMLLLIGSKSEPAPSRKQVENFQTNFAIATAIKTANKTLEDMEDTMDHINNHMLDNAVENRAKKLDEQDQAAFLQTIVDSDWITKLEDSMSSVSPQSRPNFTPELCDMPGIAMSNLLVVGASAPRRSRHRSPPPSNRPITLDHMDELERFQQSIGECTDGIRGLRLAMMDMTLRQEALEKNVAAFQAELQEVKQLKTHLASLCKGEISTQDWVESSFE